ncbi:MAG: methyl-accepting chemotaxis protein, partial [Leptolyngbyaceae cyanobacterium SL_5_9]|nr:methyl-accepting chemotaxis protein [Leptolyngbyaceae cyanobacterium SL_5_9]
EQIKLDQEQIQQDLVQRVQTEEQLKQMAIAEQSNQVLQTEVEKILTMVSAIEAGDLTVEAQSGTGATGSITNTLNRLVERLGYIIAIVLNTTERVAQGADHLEQVAIAVSDNAEQQTESVIQVQNLIETVDGLSQEATQQVSATSEAVQLTQTATRQGQREVTTIFEGIGSLQQNTNQIAKRIEMLTSYVELAAQFAKDQKRIASMTRILAVNASMLANRAAVQQDPEQFASITREFETVAAQVDDLASQTNQSLILLQQRTDQIQTTVSGLDYDVQEISQQVSDFTVGVDQSLQVLNTIQTANQQVDQTWQQVVQSNRAIADAVQTALRSVRTIAAIAVETSNQANLTKDQTHQIEQLAQTLLHTVDFFKLRPNAISSQNSSEFPLPHPPRSQTRQNNGHSSLEESHSKTVNVTAS